MNRILRNVTGGGNQLFKQSLAFTLAEVLITLGIIGVVAALTIPTLVTAYQKKVTAERLKEVYAQMIQATKLYESETGEDVALYDTQLSPKDFLNQYFVPYMKVIQTCESVEQCYQNEVPVAIDRKTPLIVRYMLVLANGTYVGVLSSAGGITFYIDINGAGKPNRSGRDIFNFFLFNAGTIGKRPGCEGVLNNMVANVKSGLYPGSFGSCYYPLALYKREQLLNLNSGLHRICNKKTGPDLFAGDACAAVIMKDGWKISKDYPWN